MHIFPESQYMFIALVSAKRPFECARSLVYGKYYKPVHICEKTPHIHSRPIEVPDMYIACSTLCARPLCVFAEHVY